MRKYLFSVFLFIFFGRCLFAQNPVPDGYREIRLKAGMEETKDALTRDPYFAFAGDPDVSMLDSPNKHQIDCEGSGFIKRAYFQFDDDRLFVIILEIDRSRLDYYTLYTRFTEQYGEPVDLNPKRAVWESSVTRLSLEYPLTIKFIDKSIFSEILDGSQTDQNYKAWLREEFLNDF